LAKVLKARSKKLNWKGERKTVWSFDIATPHSKDITEVQVNAVTGEIVSVEKETPADRKGKEERSE